MTTLYVNPNTGKDSNAGTEASPFKTITKALQEATSGSTIQLATGTYSAEAGENFPLLIDSGVKVVGNEASKGTDILIKGSGTYVSPSVARQNVTFRLKDDGYLGGVTVTNNQVRGTGVWFESSKGTLTKCTLTECKREGVFATGDANPVINDNLFSNNEGNGLAMAGSAKGEVRGNTFQQTGYGIAIQDNAAPLIVENLVTGNRSGVVLSGEARPVLRNNRIENNEQDGLTAIGKSLPDLGIAEDAGGNTFQSNGAYDLQNASIFKLVSVGNQLNPTRVKGNVAFEVASVPTPEPTPAPTPAPGPIPTPAPTPALTPSAPLKDISGHWAERFIERLAGMGIINGYLDNTFRPDNLLNRAEFAALVARAFNMSPKRKAINFKDVAGDFWAKNVIETASKAEFLSGYPDNTFRPQDYLTREQAIVATINGLGLSGGMSSFLWMYEDRAQISNYAQEEIATATEKGMVVNYPRRDRLEPTRNITRAEVVAIIYQALVTQGRVASINSSYIV